MEYVELFEKSFRDRQDAKDATEENQWLRDIVQDIQGELMKIQRCIQKSCKHAYILYWKKSCCCEICASCYRNSFNIC